MRLGAPVAGLRVGAEPDQRANVPRDPVPLRVIGHEIADEGGELLLGRGRLIRLEDARLRLHDLAERLVAQPFAVGQRASLPPPDQVRVAVDELEELRDESALADAGDADESDELRRVLAARAVERVAERAEFALAPDER